MLAIAAAVMTRPIVVSSITGAVGTALAAVAAFGLHLTANQIAPARPRPPRRPRRAI